MSIQEMLTKSLLAHDAQRDRSKQIEIGPSSIYGCKRRVWHDLMGTEKTNLDTESLAAILGTFIHAGIEKAIRREDPFGDNFIIEEEVSHGDLKGHVDLFIKDQGMVVDWKTTKVKSLRYFPSDQQKMQVQVYGWLLSQNGHTVNQVSLVAIPRDGKMGEIKTHTEDYNPEVALKGLDWLNSIKDMVTNGEVPPEPTERLLFCRGYCSYFDASGEVGCPSMRK